MAKHYILLAIDKNDGTPKYIDEVPNGKNCGCVCAECKGELEARNNGRVRIHHFAHVNGSNSIACSQTALHRLAKKIMIEEKLIPAFNNGQLEFVNVPLVEEEKDLGDIRPDLYAEYNGNPIAIEIFVSHPVDDIKFEKIRDHKLTTFEINLSKFVFETRDAVKNAIYDRGHISLVYDDAFVKSIIQDKKRLIFDKGKVKSIENGCIRECPMCTELLIGVHRYLRPKNVKVDICKNCFFGCFSEDFKQVHCLGHVDGNVNQLFLRANVMENRFMSIREVEEKKLCIKNLAKKI